MVSTGSDGSPLARLWRSLQRPIQIIITTIDRIITIERIRNYSIIFIILGTSLMSFDMITRILDVTSRGAALSDFLAHWTGGRLLLSGESGLLYDIPAQHRIQDGINGSAPVFMWFVSLPVVAALYAPFSALEYPASSTVWLVINTVLLFWCIRCTEPLAPKIFKNHRGLIYLAALASTPTLDILGSGQDTAFTLATWIIGIRLLATRRQALAGSVLGLVALKPQNAILIPFVLIATRRYKAFLSFILISILLVASSILLVGIEGIRQWMATITSDKFNQLVQQGQAWKMMSIPAFILEILPPAWSTWLAPNLSWLSVTATLLVLAICLRISRRSVKDVHAVWMATLATTLILSSHLLMYDAMLFVPVALFLIERRPSAYLRVVLLAAFALMYIVPIAHLLSLNAVWPFTLAQAPWSVLPLTALWIESLKEMLGHKSRVEIRASGTVSDTGEVGVKLD